jgi:hypothetical protein
MATVTASFERREQVDNLRQALARRGISEDNIRVTEDSTRGYYVVSVEATGEGARIVRDMLAEHQGGDLAGVEVQDDQASTSLTGAALTTGTVLGTGTGAGASGPSQVGGAIAGPGVAADLADEDEPVS